MFAGSVDRTRRFADRQAALDGEVGIESRFIPDVFILDTCRSHLVSADLSCGAQWIAEQGSHPQRFAELGNRLPFGKGTPFVFVYRSTWSTTHGRWISTETPLSSPTTVLPPLTTPIDTTLTREFVVEATLIKAVPISQQYHHTTDSSPHFIQQLSPSQLKSSQRRGAEGRSVTPQCHPSITVNTVDCSNVIS